jgi:hypothetical protein
MATNYKLKLDLAKLCGAQIIEVQGKKSVVLPVDDNGIFLSQRGAAYLDLNIRESREVKYGQTHFAKVSVNKKTFAAMSNEAKDALKNVVGNMSPDEYNPDNTTTTSSAQTPTPTSTPSPTPTANGVDISNLPF